MNLIRMRMPREKWQALRDAEDRVREATKELDRARSALRDARADAEASTVLWQEDREEPET